MAFRHTKLRHASRSDVSQLVELGFPLDKMLRDLTARVQNHASSRVAIATEKTAGSGSAWSGGLTQLHVLDFTVGPTKAWDD